MKVYLMEFLGTFFLTLSIAVLAGNALAVGLMLLALVYIGRHVSGAYYNPVLVVAGWRRDHVHTGHVLPYIVAEIVGAVAALLFVLYAFRIPFIHPLTAELHPAVIASFEVLLAFLFAFVYLSLRSKKDEDHIAGIVIGLSFAALAFLGGLFNPAVAIASIAVDAFTGGGLDKTGAWYLLIFVVGPLFGGLLAAYAHEYFHSK